LCVCCVCVMCVLCVCCVCVLCVLCVCVVCVVCVLCVLCVCCVCVLCVCCVCVLCVCCVFQRQLGALMSKLHSTYPFFIRCIKPNATALSTVFHGVEVARQLRCGGVIDAVRITRNMYPSHIDHLDFYQVYTTKHEWACWFKAHGRTEPFKVLTAAATIAVVSQKTKVIGEGTAFAPIVFLHSV